MGVLNKEIKGNCEALNTQIDPFRVENQIESVLCVERSNKQTYDEESRQKA